MREFSLFFNGDVLGWKELMPVDRLINTDGAQAVEAVQLDVGGEDMHSVVTVGHWDEKVKDVSFILFISLQCLRSSFPLRIPSISVLRPVLIGLFHVSGVRLAFR